MLLIILEIAGSLILLNIVAYGIGWVYLGLSALMTAPPEKSVRAKPAVRPTPPQLTAQPVAPSKAPGIIFLTCMIVFFAAVAYLVITDPRWLGSARPEAQPTEAPRATGTAQPDPRASKAY